MYVADMTLEQPAEHLVRSALRDTTHKTYSSAQRKFIEFCNTYGYQAIPASDYTLTQYIASLHSQGLKGSSIRVYIAAIRSLHVLQGHPVPVYSERLLLALKGAQKLSSPPDRKAPITFNILCKMFPLLEGRHDELLLKTVMAMAFFGCFRAGELCLPDTTHFDPSLHLTFSDLHFDTEQAQLQLHLKQSKTDRVNSGVEVRIGCSGHAICAYCLMLSYVNTHPDP
jgi:hypothetical protein